MWDGVKARKVKERERVRVRKTNKRQDLENWGKAQEMKIKGNKVRKKTHKGMTEERWQSKETRKERREREIFHYKQNLFKCTQITHHSYNNWCIMIRLRERERKRERESVCVCVCVWERERGDYVRKLWKRVIVDIQKLNFKSAPATPPMPHAASKHLIIRISQLKTTWQQNSSHRLVKFHYTSESAKHTHN